MLDLIATLKTDIHLNRYIFQSEDMHKIMLCLALNILE